jgi:hypothetical protein
MAAGERVVAAPPQSRTPAIPIASRADPRVGRAAAAVAEHDRRDPAGGGGIEWQSSRIAPPKRSPAARHAPRSPVIGPVGLVEALVELAG